ncbi:MAG: methytransferase partner Trm112 [Dehalococcoidia bacterium]|nr:methytransferase partner Trm112 [Dehalococcoidia bacterium]MDW8119053.1 methytransferase partner Trm112 [Chloroflexota bacterium]
MRRDLMDILVCPVCKASLSLTVELQEGEDIMTGSLWCAQCKETYPIEEGIPNLLPPSLRTP